MILTPSTLSQGILRIIPKASSPTRKQYRLQVTRTALVKICCPVYSDDVKSNSSPTLTPGFNNDYIIAIILYSDKYYHTKTIIDIFILLYIESLDARRA